MELIGWISSAILVLTIGKQVHKQYKSRSVKGVSSWLFVGQTAASLGFTIYSVLVRNWVFVVTNAIMLCNAIAGWSIYRRNVSQVTPPRASSSSAPTRGSRHSLAVP
jgi:MtN3 and saliva related transmembrane protein